MKNKNLRLVVLESPFAGAENGEVERNIAYARKCLRDCLRRNEAPIASHLLYTQVGVLDDKLTEERKLGISAGLAWAEKAEATVVYTDLGISEGMKKGIRHAIQCGRSVVYRKLK
jgi:hypothetical protein